MGYFFRRVGPRAIIEWLKKNPKTSQLMAKTVKNSLALEDPNLVNPSLKADKTEQIVLEKRSRGTSSMLVDLNLSGRNALVIAESEQAKIRARQLRSEGANVTVLPAGSPGRDASSLGKFELRKNGKGDGWKSIIKETRPFLTVISSGDLGTDQKIAGYARTVSRLVYVVDRPKLNDLNMTGIAKIGDIRVAVSTRGLSPAMAGLLRRKVESLIGEDILQVRLQGQVRSKVKRSVKDPAKRKELIYKLVRNKKILSLLKSGRFEEAKRYALNIIAAANNNGSRNVVRVSE